ncbi:MAG: hypothetical protein M1831_001490 [Alyxoria varia]|nr:MAG: hypothetical protein M1831_001490 [Alyxoria varia]
MLKSTHRAATAPQAPLPRGWTEHTALTGHIYYYEAATNTSTYTRPRLPTFHPPVPQATYDFTNTVQPSDQPSNHRPQPKQRRQPSDKPKSKHAIPGCAPWLLIKTRLGRRYAHNPATGESLWKFPPEVIAGVVEYDIQERDKKERGGLSANESQRSTAKEGVLGETNTNQSLEPSVAAAKTSTEVQEDANGHGDTKSIGSEDYEEVEIVEEDDLEDEQPYKRQRLESADLHTHSEENDELEFGEEDMAYQLAQMGGTGGEYHDEYDDGKSGIDVMKEEGEDDAAAIEESKSAFKEIFDDYGVSPFATWDKIIEEGDIIDDDRYTLLSNTRRRKEMFEEWSGAKIKSLKEHREKQARKDPKIPYLALLQKKATPKLFWPEFKRKYKREPEMKDVKLGDKDREKFYREHINRITKIPESTLKEDLEELMKSIPPSETWNRRSSASGTLPLSLQSNLKFISLKPEVRDRLLDNFIQALPEPDTLLSEAEKSDIQHKRLEQKKRDEALRERTRWVERAKKSQQRKLMSSRSALEHEREELGRALNVGREGLLSNLDNGSGAMT